MRVPYHATNFAKTVPGILLCYRETDRKLVSLGTPTNCTFLVVVNLAEDAPTKFSLVIDPAPTAHNATRMFDATYHVNITAGRLVDWVAHGDTNVYRIGSGCPR